MVATVGNFNSTNAIIFDCTKSELSLAYIEKLNGTVKNYNIPFNMIVKIDAGKLKKLMLLLAREMTSMFK